MKCGLSVICIEDEAIWGYSPLPGAAAEDSHSTDAPCRNNDCPDKSKQASTVSLSCYFLCSPATHLTAHLLYLLLIYFSCFSSLFLIFYWIYCKWQVDNAYLSPYMNISSLLQAVTDALVRRNALMENVV